MMQTRHTAGRSPKRLTEHSTALSLGCIIFFMLLGKGLHAHEYWLEPTEHHYTLNDTLAAHIRNGHHFAGSSLIMQPHRFRTGGIISKTQQQPLIGRSGDRPAIRMPLTETGLNVLFLETTTRFVSYDDVEDFRVFLNNHALVEHSAQALERLDPAQTIDEQYYRYAKTFVDVHPDDQLQSASAHSESPALEPLGQRLELIAHSNPINSTTLKISVMLESSPLPERQIELYYKDSAGQISRQDAMSDSQGMVEFDTRAPGSYMINSVWIIPPTDSVTHWESLWASLSFRRNDSELSEKKM